MPRTLGIVPSVPFGVSNEEQVSLLRRYPDRFLGLARISINAFKGMSGVRELERLVRDEGFCALGVSALVDCIPRATGATTPSTPRRLSCASPCASTPP